LSDPLILVLDEGTTSTRAMLFDAAGRLQGLSQQDIAQHYPRPGWVEHDAEEIWTRTLACARNVVEQAGGARRIAAIGIANQRETVVAWDRRTGAPLSRAIVWQDRRTAELCEDLRAAGHEDMVRRATGLLLDPYFSGTKMHWLLENEPAVAEAAASGRLALGTVESWLIFKLTGGAHITDPSNASRTLLFPLEGSDWSAELCELMGVPRAALPELAENAQEGLETDPELLGGAIPICGMAGDQQAATIGQGCLSPGETKATYGTGAFVLTNLGSQVPRSSHRLLGTVLYDIGGRRTYALEGSVFVAGSLVKWLRDSLGLVESAAATEELARSVDSSGGVVIVPALAGLGAPHWRPEARGLMSGLSFATTPAHIARAALEAMAHQTYDLAQAFAADGARWEALRIDGGMSANDWMAQDIANMLGLITTRPDFVETTALGAAMLAGVGRGIFETLEDAAAAMIGPGRQFVPEMDDADRDARLAVWQRALSAS